ncbi:hypothetical protein EZV62_027057 [Acer yangbiense]|uniref:Uncharacterized protein n=1 Tax=Acer yangbiense TaxID=1000413 RepID=A0A5C7GT17_9ROSI|nr:hypothetical protein EZV62_027057 [Acer yangbiense]
MSIPMWDLHLLNLKTSNAETMAVLRIHHSLGHTIDDVILASWESLKLAWESKIDHKGASENLRLSAGLQGLMIHVRGIILARPFQAESWAMGFLRRLKAHGSLEWRTQR